MHNKHIAIAELLANTEKELRELHLWDSVSPSAEALASTQPFAIDTLNFPQWLQFIFVPRLYFMIEQQLPLPNNSGVAAMAEEYFQVLNLNSSLLTKHLQKIDHLLSGK
ncbi:MAG: YqcC family protein [Pseudomonadota bacterium]